MPFSDGQGSEIMTDYGRWLIAMGEQGGKGTVQNIDARALLRAGEYIRVLENKVDELGVVRMDGTVEVAVK